jgi:P27 family predicted phage terminase small subunit
VPGPPPVPNNLRVLRGNPSRRPIYPEPQPAQPTDVPEPPPFLTGYAADEWWRTAPELHRLKLLTVLDVQVLAVYCIAYARWRTAEGALARMAERDAQTSGLLIKSQGGDAMQNPLVGIARRAAADMVRFAGEFGMSPAARARISGLRRWISSQSNNAGCPWPAAMRSKRSGRRPAGLRDPRANSEVVAETGGGQTSRGPRLGCGCLTCSRSFTFSRTSSAVRRKNPAISADDIPRSSESFKKNRSALSHELPMSFTIVGRKQG